MTKSTRLVELSSPEIRDAIERSNTLILPVGSIECNGPHLPVSQDCLVAEDIAGRLGQRTATLVAPTIPWGVADALMGFPGTISIGNRTLTDLVKDICRSYQRHGIKKVFILNAHIYNIWPINVAIEELRADGLYAIQAVWWSVVERLCNDMTKTKNNPHGHGSEVSTSVVMAIRGDLVDLSKAVEEKPIQGFELSHENDYPSVYAFDDYIQITRNGILGDPTLASKDEGEKIIQKSLEYLERILNDLKSTPYPLNK
ncbi:MAG: creatininase family protein [Nitrososphaerales archaeon]